MNQVFIGIDNGVTGSIGRIFVKDGKIIKYDFNKTPTRKTDSFMVNKTVRRINVKRLKELLYFKNSEVNIAIERPMTGRGRINAVVSASRAVEATELVIESLQPHININYEYINSVQWQSDILPGVYGKELKTQSLSIGKLLFPNINDSHPDRDGILIAEWLRRNKQERKIVI